MLKRFLLFAFLIIVALAAIVMVVYEGNWGRSQRQNHPEKHCVTEIAREYAFPADCMPAARSASAAVRHSPVPLPNESRAELRKSVLADNGREQEARRLVSDKNQLMDALLNRPDIPSDYGAEMVALCRDRTQDVYTRDFAVQHIGLYAEALNRRGTYDPSSREAGELRRALWDASDETGTMLATAAFRALTDLAGFDPKVDARRLDSRLLACVADANAAPSARVMSAQLCGERRVASSRNILRRIAESPEEPHVLRLAAARSLELLDGRGVAR